MSIYVENVGRCDTVHLSELAEAVVKATVDEINILRVEASLAEITVPDFEVAVSGYLP